MQILIGLLEMLVDSLTNIDMRSRKQRKRMLASASVPVAYSASQGPWIKPLTWAQISYDEQRRTQSEVGPPLRFRGKPIPGSGLRLWQPPPQPECLESAPSVNEPTARISHQRPI